MACFVEVFLFVEHEILRLRAFGPSLRMTEKGWVFAQDDNVAGLVGMTIWDRFVDISAGLNYHAWVGFGFVPLC